MLNAASPIRRSEYPRLLRLLALFAVAGSACNALPAMAASLLTNGGFETGDFSGWSVTTQGNGNWFVNTGNPSPLTTDPVAGAAAGVFYAVTDQTRPGAYSLTQSFTVPQTTAYVELSFQMFVDNYASRSITFTLNPDSGVPNQYARVDLLTAGASAFETASASILRSFYLGSDAGNASNPYGYYRFNLSSLVTPGETYQLRFASVANQGVLHQGVDAVTIIAEIPEPGSSLLFAAGLGLLFGARRHLHNRDSRGRAA
jgi:hypothetical protein